MLTSKQRARLRGLANPLEPVIMVGKGGVTDAVATETENAFHTRELIKGRVLESALMTSREVCDELAARTRAEGVQAVGGTFVLYRENRNLPEEKRIILK